MAEDTKQEPEDIHAQALRRFDAIWSVVYKDREYAISDRRFCNIAGAQWEDEYVAAAFENKPRIEINKVQQAVTSIVSEYRQNRIGVSFTSKDGSKNDELADICQGLFRADFKASGGQSAQDNCFEEGVTGGMGALAVRTELVDEFGDDDGEQKIIIDPIFDADQSVFYDLDAKKYDKSDGKFAFKLNSMTRTFYEDKYDDDPTSWPKDNRTAQFDWFSPDVVTVAEYYVVETGKEELRVYKNANGDREKYTEEELTTDKKIHLKAVGTTLTKEAVTKKKRQVRKYIMSGGKILNGNGKGVLIVGTMIPLIPFYGKRFYIDNVERFQGHVRTSRDPQVIKNIMMSKLAETSAVSANPVPVFFPEQIAGHQADWAGQNINNPAYLQINPMTGQDGNPLPMAAIATTSPPEIAPAVAALMGQADADLQETLGEQEATEQAQPNISGKAVEIIQNKLDMRTYIYVSNLERTVQRLGEVWLDVAKEVYVEDDRRMKTVGTQGEVESVVVNAEKTLDADGKAVNKFDLSRASFDVEVDVSPSTESKRAGMVRAFTGMASVAVDPAEKSMYMMLAMENMEGEGLKEVKEYNRKKLVALGVKQPNDEDKKEAEAAATKNEQQPPTPEENVLNAEAEKDQAQAMKYASEADINAAKIANVEADTELKEAQRINELDNADGKNVDRIIALDKQLRDEDVQDEERQAAQAQQSASNPNSIPLG